MYTIVVIICLEEGVGGLRGRGVVSSVLSKQETGGAGGYGSEGWHGGEGGI